MTLHPRTLPAAIAVTAFALVAGGLGSALPASAAVLAEVEVRFDVADVAASGFTTWTVPTNICAIDITAAGGNGGTATERPGGARGLGAIIATRSTVSPGDVLTIAVGARGTDGRPGGAPGGGTSFFEGGGGGGGWSGVATSAVPDQSTVIIVAGAGGAAGNWMTAHGGNAGTDAADVYYEYGPATVGGGKAGTETQGGAGGIGSWSGSPGSALQGGEASSTAGGGGGGYFGGGGGSVNYVQSGGGGGSSYPFAASPDRLSYSIKSLTDLENGWVTIGFDPRDDADTCQTPITAALGPDGEPLDGQTVAAGDAVTIEGSDWPSGEVLTMSFDEPGTTLGTVTVGLDGTFSAVALIPSGTTGGDYQVVLTPTSGTLATLSYAVTVSPAAGAPGALPELAVSGLDREPLVATGIALALVVALGVALTVAAPRPRRFRMPARR